MLASLKIKQKLIVVIGGFLILSISLMIAIVSYRSYKSASTNAYAYAGQLARYHSESIRGSLEKAMSSMRTVSSFMEAGIASGSEDISRIFDSALVQTLKKDTLFYGTWCMIDPGILPCNSSQHCPYPKGYSPYAQREGNGIGFSQTDYEEGAANEYYTVPKTTAREALLKPYIDSDAGNKMMTSVCMPIRVGDSIVGVVGIDLLLKTFNTLVSQIKPFQDGYAYLVGSDGFIIGHPLPDRAGKNIKSFGATGQVLDAIKGGREISVDQTSELDQQLSRAIYVPVTVGETRTPWSFVVSIPKVRATAGAKTLLIWTVITRFLVLCAMLSILVIFARAITAPINRLAAVATKVAQGDLNLRVETSSRDEIGTLERAFSSMIANNKDKITILNKIPTPIFAVDNNMSVTFINESGASIAGKTPKTCEGMKCFDIFKTAHCNTPECRVRQAMLNNGIFTSRTIAKPKAATAIPIQYTGAPIINDAGEVVGGLEYIADITEIDTMIKEAGRVVDAVSSCMEAAVRKDLTKAVSDEFDGSYGVLVTNVNDMLQTINTALSQVTQATEQVSSASQQISAGSQSLAQSANEQASSLETIASSLEEISAMTKQNAENANQAKCLASNANNNTNQGMQAMVQMSSAIARIKNSSDQTAKIVKTIDEIAMQTNLLALNAAVEAARAGEAGRGFAVVAEEVRNLAQRSAEAAKNTANLIEESVRNAEDGVRISADVSKAFDAIADGTRKVNDLIAEIAAASQEQALGIGQVNISVGQMDKVTQQNAANSEESASASEELSSQAQELATMIGQFQLNRQENLRSVYSSVNDCVKLQQTNKRAVSISVK